MIAMVFIVSIIRKEENKQRKMNTKKQDKL